MALMGMTWNGSPRPRRPQYTARDLPTMVAARPQVTPALPRTVLARHAMAAALYRAADWLAPSVSDVRAA
ncbi:MAG: hypothetical protein NVSMB2_06060 [Chloroflexota bacterium]